MRSRLAETIRGDLNSAHRLIWERCSFSVSRPLPTYTHVQAQLEVMAFRQHVGTWCCRCKVSSCGLLHHGIRALLAFQVGESLMLLPVADGLQLLTGSPQPLAGSGTVQRLHMCTWPNAVGSIRSWGTGRLTL